MEKIIKEFKGLSQFLGAFALVQAANLLRTFSELKNMDASMLSDVDLAATGVSASTILSILKVVSVVPGILTVLALGFLWYKGCQEAKDPSSAKSHIIISTIMMVFFAIGTVASLGELFNKPADVVIQILEVVILGCSAVMMFYYRKYAKQIRVVE